MTTHKISYSISLINHNNKHLMPNFAKQNKYNKCEIQTLKSNSFHLSILYNLQLLFINKMIGLQLASFLLFQNTSILQIQTFENCNITNIVLSIMKSTNSKIANLCNHEFKIWACIEFMITINQMAQIN